MMREYLFRGIRKDNGKFAIAQNGNRNCVDDFELFERNEYFKRFTVIGNIYDHPELMR